jgi:hypothetical protein
VLGEGGDGPEGPGHGEAVVTTLVIGGGEGGATRVLRAELAGASGPKRCIGVR